MVNNDHPNKYSWSCHWARRRRGPMISMFLGSSRDFWMAMVKDDLSAWAKFILGLMQWCKSSPYMGCSFLVSQYVTGWKVLVSSQSLLLVHKFSYKFRFLDDDDEKLFAFVCVCQQSSALAWLGFAILIQSWGCTFCDESNFHTWMHIWERATVAGPLSFHNGSKDVHHGTYHVQSMIPYYMVADESVIHLGDWWIQRRADFLY